jgi:hypothetical protein
MSGHYIGPGQWASRKKSCMLSENRAEYPALMYKKLMFVLTLVGVAAASRLLPHPPNFTPIAAMALFGGAFFASKRMAFLVPLLAMGMSDVALGLLSGKELGFHSTMPVVYVTFAITVCLGFLLREHRGGLRVASVSLAASLLFFVTTNLAVWAEGVYYAKNMTGLLTCFVAAIPFFHNTVLGDACYVAVMFGAMAWAEKRAFSLSSGA